MSDNLSGRVGRLVSGGLHSLIDKMERAAPEAVMGQAIREVQDAIEEVRGELAKVITERHMAVKRLADENRRYEELTQKAELALAQQHEDLAEAAVGRQLDIEAQLPIIEQRIQVCAERQGELEGFVLALQARQREMEDELRTITTTRREAENLAAQTSCNQVEVGVHNKVEHAASAFDRARGSVAGATTGVPQPTPAEAKQLQELDNLARKNRISERMATLKGKVK